MISSQVRFPSLGASDPGQSGCRRTRFHDDLQAGDVQSIINSTPGLYLADLRLPCLPCICRTHTSSSIAIQYGSFSNALYQPKGSNYQWTRSQRRECPTGLERHTCPNGPTHGEGFCRTGVKTRSLGADRVQNELSVTKRAQSGPFALRWTILTYLIAVNDSGIYLPVHPLRRSVSEVD